MLSEEKHRLPKIQILIYPWIQMVNTKLPSYIFNINKSFITQTGLKLSSMSAWYLGINELNASYTKLLESIENNDLFNLIEDKELLKKYK